MNRRRYILIFAIVIVAAVVLIPVVHNIQLRSATDDYIARLKAEGQPMDLAQVVQTTVPANENGAPLITNALAQISLEPNYTNSIIYDNAPYEMNRTIPGKEMIGWHSAVIYGPDTWPRHLTNTWDELGAQLAERQNNLNNLRKLIEMPTLDFHLDYSKMDAFEVMSHLPQLKLALYWLEASEYYNLHRGQTADACMDVRTMLALINGETQERYEISQLIHCSLVQMIADPTWDILQTTNVSDENLAQLQRDWQSLQFIEPLKNAFLFERVNDLRLLNSFRNSSTDVSWLLGSFLVQKGYGYEQAGEGASAHWVLVDKSPLFKKLTNKITIPWDKARWRWFWSYRDELQALPIWEVVLEGTQKLEDDKSFMAVQAFVNTNFTRLNLDSAKDNPCEIVSQNTLTQLGAIRRAAEAEVTRNVVITAIALKRYQIRYGKLPDSLAQLVPNFLQSVPTDYMDGQPLRYRRNANGTFLLYSVGQNGRDDGGNPAWESTDVHAVYYAWQSIHALDWVWPQPAPQEEIDAFFARQKSSD